MKGLRRTLLFFAVAGLLAALPAVAESFTVILANGTVIESRYPPRAAADGADKLLLLTEWGNWIALERADVREIRGAGSWAGFDREIDTRPRFVGAAPNDAPGPEAEPTPSDGSEVAEAVINHLLRQNLAAIEERLLAARANTVHQFAEPPVVGLDQGTGFLVDMRTGLRSFIAQSATEPDPVLLLLQGLVLPPTDPTRGWVLGQPTVVPLAGLAAAPPSLFWGAPTGN